jgi:stage II sporulation protein D
VSVHRPSSRPAVLVIAVVAVLTSCTGDPSPSGSAAPSSMRAGSGSSPSVDATPATPSATRVADGQASLSPPAHGSFLVRGEYPRVESRCRRARQPILRARYPGTLSVQRIDDGTLSVLVTLPFERYLEGIAEVPSSWPAAALEAQAIAARSYALATTGWTGESRRLPSPICSTTSCQVYRGIPVPAEPTFGRWVAAVRRTAGMMLVDGGRPAQTVYFSTSNGRTYGNDEVFGSDPLPYLRPVVERDDHASPTSRWRVTLPFRDIGSFLEAADLWPGGTAIRRVEVDGSVVRVGGGGTTRILDVSEFRSVVNTWAPCLMPGRYPTDGDLGSPLPVTVPSQWFTASRGPDALVLDGRGWGHGVGMVQWGAYGKASRGLSAAEIMASYYGGLRPQRFPEPGVIDVEVASGLTSLRVVPSRGGATLDGEPLGRRPVVLTGGAGLRVELVDGTGG